MRTKGLRKERIMYINGIDYVDNKIVRLLKDNARMSYSDIASEIGLSRTAVTTRITNLEKAGIIKEGIPVVIYPQKKEAFETIEKKAMEMHSDLKCINIDNCKVVGIENNTEHYQKVFAGVLLAFLPVKVLRVFVKKQTP